MRPGMRPGVAVRRQRVRPFFGGLGLGSLVQGLSGNPLRQFHGDRWRNPRESIFVSSKPESLGFAAAPTGPRRTTKDVLVTLIGGSC